MSKFLLVTAVIQGWEDLGSVGICSESSNMASDEDGNIQNWIVDNAAF